MRTTETQKIFNGLWSLTRTRYFLLILTILTLILRMITFRLKYFLGYDTYFHAAYVEYSAKIGEWVNLFPYANAPWGMLIDQFHPKGFWMLPLYFHRLLSPFGVSLETAFKMTPPIIGIATIIVGYFAVKSLYNNEVATLSSLFIAISFGHIFRSMANYYRGDNYFLLWYSIALLGIGFALELANQGREKYRRLLFYIIPGLAAGMAAAFWSAYYLIFVFLLSNALFIAIGALLLRRDWAFLDSLALVISTAFGALVANVMGAILGYGMFGWNRPDGIEVARNLGLHFELVKDAFLLVYLKYAVPLTLIGVLLLFGVHKGVRGMKGRSMIAIILLLAMVIVGIKYHGFIERVFLRFLQRFGEKAIAETRRTSLRDVWVSYGTLLLALPFFILHLRPSRAKMADFVVLSFALPSVAMVTIWARFLFIGSLAVTILAAVGAWEMMQEVRNLKVPHKKYLPSLIIILLVIPTVLLAVQNTMNLKPFINEEWEAALTNLGITSNKNDVVLTWWDQAHWVTYYAHRGALPGGAPNEFVAKYYMGMVKRDELMSLGVDYIIVSYDTVRKFPAVLKIANVPLNEYPMIPIPLVEIRGETLIFSIDGYSITARPGNDNNWKVIANAGNSVFSPMEAYVENSHGIEEVNVTGAPKADAYVYINLNYGYAVLMNWKAFNTTLARLMFTESLPGYSMVYSDGGYIKIFRFEHPNVAVVSREGRIVLKFTNATGTRLVLEGFMDNGTRVFEESYDVTGLDEFSLPPELEESAVVRYTYERNGKVLDRGTFRLNDAWGQ
ncbi:oligosaccharyl transferase, STT3 subunit [Thermococcus sp. 18S1]|uniref:oligosaccharyl transferase, STT3 subunit n=1 Tax=Thermococcus sp. 18S1 TaxID=1638210 RepID=UPI00143BAD45|nr:oligosaccharyl transferase, STT3 subunit [Thermococcus sp. 18S1]NJE30299.1 oligosaccharyl transferase, STT3 subunit [Thermococcus sp. 18S1]